MLQIHISAVSLIEELENIVINIVAVWIDPVSG
jgi:hypothetical protein